MRLVNSEKLIEYCNNQKVKTIDANDIARFPTVDAAPVVHGKWISAGEFEACSVCGATQLKTINTYYGKATKLWVKTNYCSNCGAKMDLERLDDRCDQQGNAEK